MGLKLFWSDLFLDLWIGITFPVFHEVGDLLLSILRLRILVIDLFTYVSYLAFVYSSVFKFIPLFCQLLGIIFL